MPAIKAALLSTTYFGPVQYYTKFLLHGWRVIEVHDNYTKQTYRNRGNIFGANGLLPLSIPVLKGMAHKTRAKEIRIDMSKKWKKLHWKGIESAYMHSPFFEYYMDEIRSIFDMDQSFLLDLNMHILQMTLSHLDIEPVYGPSDDFIDEPDGEYEDYREIIHPKKDPVTDPDFNPQPYHQVFSEKHGFLPNLSILDLLFNEGPNSRSILEKSITRL